MISSTLLDLAFVMIIAAGFGMIARLLRQPLLLAYLVAGILISSLGFLNLNNQETFRTFSDLGIMFLLFLVGLEINYTSLRTVGRTSLIVGIGQIIFTFAIGFLLAILFSFPLISSAYIAITLTFSSTVIIVKLLSDKRDMNNLYGKISVGFLLVQDFVAILILIFLSGIDAGNNVFVANLALTIFKGIALFILMLLLGRTLLPAIVNIIGASQELLFLVSIAWVFTLVSFVQYIGFSIEIGGFLAGLALANSIEHYEIASRIRPLRDFFVVIFFVILGSFTVMSSASGLIIPVVIFSLFVLVGNPLIVLIIMGLLGYRKRTSFFAGVTVAQISEFSLVIAALGLKLGHITSQDTALIAATGVITIAGSTYLIIYAEKLYQWLEPFLSLFERKHLSEDANSKQLSRPIILIGYHRTGQSIAANLPKEELLIIDFDPDSIPLLQNQGFDFLLDDIGDTQLMQRLDLSKTKLIISTSPELNTNIGLVVAVKRLKKKKPSLKVIVRARMQEELNILYEYGADYVLLPHFTAGQHLGRLIRAEIKNHFASLKELKEKDLALLEQN